MPKRLHSRKLALRDQITVRLKEDFVIPAGTELVLGPIQTCYAEPPYEAVIDFGADHAGFFTLDEDLMRAHPDLFEIEEVAR